MDQTNPENGKCDSPFLSSSQSSSDSFTSGGAQDLKSGTADQQNSSVQNGHKNGQSDNHQPNNQTNGQNSIKQEDSSKKEFESGTVQHQQNVDEQAQQETTSQKNNQLWDNNQINKADKQNSSNDSSSDDDDEKENRRRRRTNHRRTGRRASNDPDREDSASQSGYQRREVKRDRSRSRSYEGGHRSNNANHHGGSSSQMSNKSVSAERGHHNRSKSSRYDNMGDKRSHHRGDQHKSTKNGNDQRSGRNSSNRIIMPSLNRHLYSFQQFSQMQGENVEYERVVSAYDEYKADHEKFHQKIFFQDHKDEAWFREKYDPETVYNLRLQQNAHASQQAQKFFTELQVAIQDTEAISSYLNLEVDIERIKTLNEQQTDATGPPLHGFDPNSMTLYLKNVPVDVNRLELIELVGSIAGFTSLSMSQPLMTHNFVRYAWISFDSEENCTKAKAILDDQLVKDQYKLNPVKSQGARKQIRITPAMPCDYVERDNKLCRKLIEEVFDRERQISAPFNFEIIEKLTIEQQLDVMLIYLRRVHGFCLYSASQYDDERMLASKCGSQHARAPPTIQRSDLENNLEYHETKMFEKRYLKFAEDKISNGPQLPQNPREDPWLLELKQEYASEKIKEIQEGKKYQCRLCQKNFCGREFVIKHIFNKHEEQLSQKFNQRVFDELFKKNYFSDPNKFVNSGASQSGSGQPFDQSVSRMRRQDDGRGRPSNYRSRDNGNFDSQRKQNYIDWDDPNTNVSLLKTTVVASTAKQDQPMQDAQNNNSQTQPTVNNSGIVQGMSRQIVSYDDLF